MKNSINRISVLGLSITLGLASLLPVAGFAESQCKGLEKKSCERKADCSWVDGYKRKDGKKVSSYCRSASKKSTKKSSTKQTDTKKASTQSSTKKKDDKK